MPHVEEHGFPPFPTPPEGAEIMPFGAFVPMGYRLVTDASGEPIEVDAWAGIKTVKVLNEEEAAQKRKARRRRRNAGNTTDATGRLIPWWEEWEEGEAGRETSFDSRMGLEDRVCLAADDFRVGRTWPEIALGVRLLWDQFRLYIGLISSIPVYKKVKNKQKGQVDGPNQGEEASDEEEDAPRAKQTRMVIIQDSFEQTPLPGKTLEPTPDKSTAEAQRLQAFVDDMEKTVKVFLSSYMRDTGLIWTDRNLVIAPTVLFFFLRFMLRNRVFADSEKHLNNLKRAFSVAELAQKELPLTAKHGRVLPGEFDIGCKECWGFKGSTSVQISAAIPTNDTPSNGIATHSDTSSAFETELKEHDVEIVPSDVVLDSITARQVLEDNLDTDHQVPVTTIPVTGDPWLAAVEAEEYTTASWTDVHVTWLMQIIGPSVFPLTMTTGIVEFSTRRVRDVIPPGVKPTLDGDHNVSGVEEALEERFYRVVLTPWVRSVDEETPDFPRPMIGAESRGVIAPDGLDAWDPYSDDVTILVEGGVDLMVGMGLCGTWVQLAREGDGERHPRECYWYIESLVASLPSYYTEGEVIEEVGGEEDEET